jgi:hypothetical protein
MDLDFEMKSDDPELLLTIPVIYEIVYILMFKLYAKHRDPTTDEEGNELMPEVDLLDFLPRMLEFEQFNCELNHSFLKNLFDDEFKLLREKVVGRLSVHRFKLL